MTDYLPSLTEDQAREVFQNEVNRVYSHLAKSLYLAELCFSRQWSSDWSFKNIWRARFDQQRDSQDAVERLMMIVNEDEIEDIKTFELPTPHS